MSQLNIVFHKITQYPTNNWEVTPEYFWEIFNWCKKNYPNFHIYFDDGYRLTNLQARLKEISQLSTLAIITDEVGKRNCLTWKDIGVVKKLGFKLASHSVSHPSLYTYNGSNKTILKNPFGGEYQLTTRGKKLISENEIKFQLIESKRELFNRGFEIDEFVFPYGLYSDQTILLLDELDIYKYYTTCDEQLYNGGKLIPRVLIEGKRSIKETILCLTNIIDKSKK